MDSANAIQALFVAPPIAIARLGGSSTPQDAFSWTEEPNPRDGASTAVRPEWTLDVQPDGSVQPRLPQVVAFRDGALIRPVCPFFEIWAWVGANQSAEATWVAVPLTATLLLAQGATLSDLTVQLEAINAKAARRRNMPDLRFGTFPPLQIRGNDFSPVEVLGVSPPGVAEPMIPRGRSIPMGSLRFVRSATQPPAGSTAWDEKVSVETLRFRFTPPAGHFYGPPAAAQPRQMRDGRTVAAVPAPQAFLSPTAGWFDASTLGIDQPADTYDAVEENASTGPSLGVVDDTSDARIVVALTLPGGAVLRAQATLFVGPPDFAPDRRPFLSLADEVNDRTASAESRSAALTVDETDDWVEDLFKRVFETVSLMNVDNWRRQHAKTLVADELDAALSNDGLNDDRALGAKDKLRNSAYRINPVVAGVDPLSLSAHVRMRHRALSDLVELKRFVQANKAGRLKELVRMPFEVGPAEGPSDSAQERTTMKMPPFMRNSNAQPLTLTAWQYDLLQNWAAAVEKQGAAGVPVAGVAPAMPMALQAAAVQALPAAKPLSQRAQQRLQRVLDRLDARGR